jgi:ubiquinone biosynthesis accessory factor UbiJ
MPAFPSPSVPVLATINHVLDQAGWARSKLQPFAGKSVHITMLPFVLTFLIGSDGSLQAGDADPDLDIVLPANAPILALQGNERVMKAAQLNGPADLADALSFVLRNLRWDIEEDLSKVLGDVVAHRIVAALGTFADWQRQSTRNLAENVGEYLVEEKQALVKSSEFTPHQEGVASLRSDLARVESRIKGLKTR